MKHFRWLGIALFGIYLVWAVQAASHRRLWYDELYTLAIAREDPANMWRAETAGFDFSLPMVHLLSWLALHLPLAEEISVRIAPIAGLAILAFCLIVFVGRRLGLPYGLIAGSIVLLIGTNTEFTLLEARPYGILVGFVGVTLIGWQAAADEDGEWRRFGLAGVAIGLTGALASHVYALLLYCPFGAAELWRWRERRRPDWPMGVAFLASLTPVFLYLPLLSASRQLTLAGPVYALDVSRIAKSYGYLLMTTIELLPMLLLIWVAAWQSRRVSPPYESDMCVRVPKRERVFAVTMMLLPVLGYLLARVTHILFFPRYSFPFIGGYAMLLAYATYGWSRGKSESAWLFAGTAMVCMLFPIVLTGLSPQHPPRAGQVRQAELEMAAGDDPIVVSSGMVFLEMNRYLPPDLARRLVYIADPELAIKFVESDGIDRPLALSVPWTKPMGRVVPYHEFTSGHNVFWWYGNGRDPLEWTLAQWKNSRADIQTVAVQGEYRLNRITLH